MFDSFYTKTTCFSGELKRSKLANCFEQNNNMINIKYAPYKFGRYIINCLWDVR